MTAETDIPEGFTPHFRKSKVTDPWEPLFWREVDGGIQIGTRLNENHCNGRGFVHGGVIAALADNAMGLSYVHSLQDVRERDRKVSAVTISLQVDYASGAAKGQWLQIEPRVIKSGKSIGFVDALITGDGETIARASATFKAVR